MTQAGPSPLISAYFSITGKNLDPDTCTKAIGIHPTRAARRGEKRRPESKLKLRTSIWTVAIDKEPSFDIDPVIAKVLDTVWPKREEICRFLQSTAWPAGFGSVVSIYDERPLLCLSPLTLQRLAYFGVEYCLDLHDYSE